MKNLYVTHQYSINTGGKGEGLMKIWLHTDQSVRWQPQMDPRFVCDYSDCFVVFFVLISEIYSQVFLFNFWLPHVNRRAQTSSDRSAGRISSVALLLFPSLFCLLLCYCFPSCVFFHPSFFHFLSSFFFLCVCSLPVCFFCCLIPSFLFLSLPFSPFFYLFIHLASFVLPFFFCVIYHRTPSLPFSFLPVSLALPPSILFTLFCPLLFPPLPLRFWECMDSGI